MKAIFTLLIILGIAAAWYFTPAPVQSGSGQAVHRMSPDNIFYLREYISVATPRGAVGMFPGQQVQLDASAQAIPGKIVVTDGTNSVALDPGSLTHDMDEAIALRNQDQDNQSKHDAQLAEANADLAAQRRETEIVAAQDIDAQGSASNAAGFDQSSLQDPTQYQGSAAGGASYIFFDTGKRHRTTKTSGDSVTAAAAPAENVSQVSVARIPRTQPQGQSSSLRPLPMHPSTATSNRTGVGTAAQ